MLTSVTFEKLQALLDQGGWEIDSVAINLKAGEKYGNRLEPLTTIILRGRKSSLELQSSDERVFRYCLSLKPALNEAGEDQFRCVEDTGRYYRELDFLSSNNDEKLLASVEKCTNDQIRISFAPEPLVADFLRSRDWGNSKYLPLKVEYFDVLASIMIETKGAFDAAQRLQKTLPQSEPYADRIGDLLGRAYGKYDPPVKGYLRYADATNVSLAELAIKMVAEFSRTDDLFRMLAKRGGLRGSVGLPYIVDVYRRYSEWARPLVAVLSDAVCIVDNRPRPDPEMGLTKRVDLVKQSRFGDIFDCFNPDVRHAASHNAVFYDDKSGRITFSNADEHRRSASVLEMSYAEFSHLSNRFARGLIPGLLIAVLLRQQAQLLTTLMSGDYLKLLLLIDNTKSESGTPGRRD